MKMLFDENLSHKLVRLLEDLLPTPFMFEMLA
jgi:predicted nuclease of predicted toxin-antitoxin system